MAQHGTRRWEPGAQQEEAALLDYDIMIVGPHSLPTIITYAVPREPSFYLCGHSVTIFSYAVVFLTIILLYLCLAMTLDTLEVFKDLRFSTSTLVLKLPCTPCYFLIARTSTLRKGL